MTNHFESGSSLRRRLALGITLLTPLLLCVLLALLVERPFWRFGVAPVPRAAVLTLRDDVPSEQKWISSAFTLPYINEAYDEAIYLNEMSDSDSDIRSAFVAELTRLLQQYDAVDVLLLAHTNHYIMWVEDVDPDLRRKLRLVYNTGCYNSDQLDSWLALGADAAIGHPGLSASPIFYVYFLRRWTLGMPADQALQASNAQMRTFLHRATDVAPGPLFEVPSYIDTPIDASDPESIYANSEAFCAGRCDLSIGTTAIGPTPEGELP